MVQDEPDREADSDRADGTLVEVSWEAQSFFAKNPALIDVLFTSHTSEVSISNLGPARVELIRSNASSSQHLIVRYLGLVSAIPSHD